LLRDVFRTIPRGLLSINVPGSVRATGFINGISPPAREPLVVVVLRRRTGPTSDVGSSPDSGTRRPVPRRQRLLVALGELTVALNGRAAGALPRHGAALLPASPAHRPHTTWTNAAGFIHTILRRETCALRAFTTSACRRSLKLGQRRELCGATSNAIGSFSRPASNSLTRDPTGRHR